MTDEGKIVLKRREGKTYVLLAEWLDLTAEKTEVYVKTDDNISSFSSEADDN